MSIDPADMPVPHGGPAMDEYGFPVVPPSKTLSYLLVAGLVICAVGAAGFWLAGVVFERNNHAVVGISMGFGVVGTVAGIAATESDGDRAGRLTQAWAALGPLGKRVVNVAGLAAVLMFLAGLATFYGGGASD